MLLDGKGIDPPLVEVTVQLIGNDEGKPFLPAIGDPSTYTLDRYRIIGATLRGTHPRMSCEASGILTLDFPSTLVITAE